MTLFFHRMESPLNRGDSFYIKPEFSLDSLFVPSPRVLDIGLACKYSLPFAEMFMIESHPIKLQ